MKRFVTYLYVYRNGQKMKNIGYIRVDVRGHILNMQINMKETDLKNQKGAFYLLVRKEDIKRIPLTQIWMIENRFSGNIVFDCKEQEEPFEFENIVGVCICYENEGYVASCWKDGEDEIVANAYIMENTQVQTEKISAASMDTEEEQEVQLVEFSEQSFTEEDTVEGYGYRKVNLNEIYLLPSHYWHFSNNSFLLHGFWNYGYLVFKENMSKNEKRITLGVPGIFEQPEMVMATYFGFSNFEALPNQVQEMEIGQYCECDWVEKNQLPKEGTFGCWFVSL